MKNFENAMDLINDIFKDSKTKIHTKQMIINAGYCLKTAMCSDDYKERELVATSPYISDEDFLILAKDENFNVRRSAASTGKHPELFYNDPHYCVRKQVAINGDYLDFLYKDEYYEVRVEVANHGEFLEELSNDKKTAVKLAVINHGYNLDKFFKERNVFIDELLIEKGYRLEDIVNDELRSKVIRVKAKEKLAEISENQNND